MSSSVIYSFAIGFVGAILFLLVDRYEKNTVAANLLKLVALVISSLAILHKLRPFGVAPF
jgi:hypothetical protein